MKTILLIILPFLLNACFLFNRTSEKNFYPEAFTEKEAHKTWTIIVYMNADNSLYSYAPLNINQMENIDLKDEVKIIILWDDAITGKAKLLKVAYDANSSGNIVSYRLTGTINGYNFSPTETPEVNMLDTALLSGFVDYAKSFFPSDHYAVIFWSHSDGWRGISSSQSGDGWRGIGSDDHKPAGSLSTSITNDQLANTLIGKGIDVVSFDSCLQGGLEDLWAFKKAGSVPLIIASANNIPGTGWHYTLFLKAFMETYRRPYDFIAAGVQAYQANYSNYDNTSLAGYDLRLLDTEILRNFFYWVEVNRVTEKNIFYNSKTFQIESSTLFFQDLYDYVLNTEYPDKILVKNMLEKMIIYSWHKNYGANYKTLSILGIKTSWDAHYDEIPLAVDTQWNEVLQWWLNN